MSIFDFIIRQCNGDICDGDSPSTMGTDCGIPDEVLKILLILLEANPRSQFSIIDTALG